jgi:hypothetical protein
MRLEVKIEFRGMRDFAIDNGTGRTIAAPIGIPVVLGEETDVMPLPDNYNRDGRVNRKFLASI